MRASMVSVRRLIRSIREQTAKRTSPQSAEELVESLNRLLGGWANYFKLGSVSAEYRAVDQYTGTRLRRWLRHKHKVRSGGYRRFPAAYLYKRLGLVRLGVLRRDLPWAQA